MQVRNNASSRAGHYWSRNQESHLLHDLHFILDLAAVSGSGLQQLDCKLFALSARQQRRHFGEDGTLREVHNTRDAAGKGGNVHHTGGHRA